jgi:hypothetical protein
VDTTLKFNFQFSTLKEEEELNRECSRMGANGRGNREKVNAETDSWEFQPQHARP